MPPATCTHTDLVRVTSLPDPLLGCETCLELDGSWVHLRMCLVCGRVGCCDNSPGRHATAHFHDTGHALVRSAEPDEAWAWCYVDEVPMHLDGLTGE